MKKSALKNLAIIPILWLVGAVIVVGLVIRILIGGEPAERKRVEERFNLRLEGRVVRVQPMGTGYDDGIVYMRLNKPTTEKYDPRDTTDFFYAVAEDRWAGINDRILGRGGGLPDYDIKVGDSVVVEGRGTEDSLFVYRCDSLLTEKPIFVSYGFIYNTALHRAFEWPPPDSLAGRGRTAYEARCQ